MFHGLPTMSPHLFVIVNGSKQNYKQVSKAHEDKCNITHKLFVHLFAYVLSSCTCLGESLIKKRQDFVTNVNIYDKNVRSIFLSSWSHVTLIAQ